MIYYITYKSPIGTLYVGEENSSLVFISLSKPHISMSFNHMPCLDNAVSQLNEYFNSKRTVFDLPFNLKGTKFQIKVWQALLSIPYAQTVSYQDIAIKIGNPKAVRAVGAANAKNPLAIIIPCHRVIGKNGKLTGYNGGLSVKEFLLNLERNNKYA